MLVLLPPQKIQAHNSQTQITIMEPYVQSKGEYFTSFVLVSDITLMLCIASCVQSESGYAAYNAWLCPLKQLSVVALGGLDLLKRVISSIGWEPRCFLWRIETNSICKQVLWWLMIATITDRGIKKWGRGTNSKICNDSWWVVTQTHKERCERGTNSKVFF